MAREDYTDFIEVVDNSIVEDPFETLSEINEPSKEEKRIANQVKKVIKEAEKEMDEYAEPEEEKGSENVVIEPRTPMDEDDILRAVKMDRDAAVQAQANFADKIRTCYNAYHAIVDAKYNVPGRSSIVSSDVMDTIEWMMPSLMRVFTASHDIVVIQPVGGEDVTAAEQHQALINYQFNYKMEGFTKFYTWFKDALIYGFGVIKITWETFYEKKSVFYPEMTEEEFTALTIQPNISIEGYDEYEDVTVTELESSDGTKQEAVERATVFRNVNAFIKKNVYSGPWLENIPVSSFYIEPGARTIREANFVGHRVRRTMDYLRRMEREGIYHNVDEVIPYAEGDSEYNSFSGLSELEGEHSGLNKELMATPSDGREYKWVWECWVKLDIDGDGLLEPLLVTFTDDVLLRVEENPFDHGEAPFETIVPIVDCHRLYGISITDLVMEFQRMKTSLYRNVFDNLAFSVNNFYLVARNSGTDIGALINVKPGSVVFTDDAHNSVREVKPESITSSMFNLFEYLDGCKENRTGITKYNSGLDSNTLNHMLDIETPVPMADGSIKLLKDITDGDLIIGSNGRATKVVKAHEIQYPKKAYEMVFASGDVIKAGGEHLWSVQTPWDRESNGPYRVLDTDTIYAMDSSVKKRRTITIPRVQRPEFTSTEALPVDPYIIGYWLGNGNSYDPVVTINSLDTDIFDYFKNWAESYGGSISEQKDLRSNGSRTIYISGTPLLKALKEFGLLKIRGKDHNTDKFIPEIYLRSSYSNRLELLRGLMDSDGTHGFKSSVMFTQSEGQLLTDVVRLIRSLGGWVHPKKKKQSKTGMQYTKDFYVACFRIFDNPFKALRKANKWEPIQIEATRQAIVSITPTEKCLMRCLTVDAEDGLFCVGDHFQVSHNTATGVSAIMTASQQRIELIARLLAETGVKYAFRKMIALNQQFITDKMVLRLFNKPLEITPDKLDGSFDLMVNVGIGAGLKELQQSQMLNLLNILPSLAQLGLVKPKHVHYVVSKLLESMGYKDIENFIELPPEGAGMPQEVGAPAGGPPPEGMPPEGMPPEGMTPPDVNAQPMQTAAGPASPVAAPTMFM